MNDYFVYGIVKGLKLIYVGMSHRDIRMRNSMIQHEGDYAFKFADGMAKDEAHAMEIYLIELLHLTEPLRNMSNNPNTYSRFTL